MKPLAPPFKSTDLSQSATADRCPALLSHLRRSAPLAVLLAAFCPLNALQVREKSPAAETGRLTIKFPARYLRYQYWVYVDEKLVSFPLYGETENWIFLPTPQGEEVYGKGGLTAVIDDNGKILYVNSELARANHFDRTLDLPLSPGTHTVEILVEGSGPMLNDAFPFIITGKDVEVHRRQVTEYDPKTPNVLDLGAVAWAAPAFRRACPGDSSPDTVAPDYGPMKRKVTEWYLAMPVVKALHEAGPPYLSVSRTRKVVRLDLPGALGGPREFDSKEIQAIINVLGHLVDTEIPSQAEIVECQKTYYRFAEAYAEYRKARELTVDRDINNFRQLAQDLDQSH